jgi:cytochrome c2
VTGALLLAALAASAAAAPADVAAGEAIYARCQACHALAYDRTGPRHCGLIGRRAGSVPGYAYSEAMKEVEDRVERRDARPLPRESDRGHARHDDGLRGRRRREGSAPP